MIGDSSTGDGLNSYVDATLLRSALRLVHCLQKERGASCAFLSPTSSDHTFFMMERSLIDSNNAIKFMLYNNKILGKDMKATLRIKESLHKIRTQLNKRKQQKHAETKTENKSIKGKEVKPNPNTKEESNGQLNKIHRILVLFNNIISGVVHEYFLEHGAIKRKIRSNSDISDLRRQGVDSEDEGKRVEKSSFFSPQDDHNKNENKKGINSSPNPTHSRITQLFNILGFIVKLKEATGRERAILSAMYVALNDNSRLHNDLVLEVENQRQLVDELKHLPPGPIKNLIEDLSGMNKELIEIQNRILEGVEMNFNEDGDDDDKDNEVQSAHNESKSGTGGDNNISNSKSHKESFKYSKKSVWDLLTVYIDRLHSVELLTIEEIEFCGPEEKPTHMLSNESQEKNRFQAESRLLNTSSVTSNESDDPKLLKQSDNKTKEEEKVSINDPFSILTSTTRGIDQWEINLYELKFLSRIGQGSAGTTYLGTWSNQKVAIKVASMNETGLEGFRTEVEALQKLHHPNIIRLLGSVYHQNPLTFCLVLEYCNSGDLAKAMSLPTPANFFFHVASSVAKGMSYLHTRNIIHRDIKPTNILCEGNISSGNYIVKITDFGVAANDEDINGGKTTERTAETGTYRWMAPEVIRHEIYNKMADVYSFAVLMWQLITREDPFLNLSQIEAAGKVAIEHARPIFPNKTPDPIKKLIEQCWSEHPNDRLAFSCIIKNLYEIKAGLSKGGKSWLDTPLGHPVYNPRFNNSADSDDKPDIVDNHDSDASSGTNKNDNINSNIKNKEARVKRGIFKMFSKK